MTLQHLHCIHQNCLNVLNPDSHNRHRCYRLYRQVIGKYSIVTSIISSSLTVIAVLFGSYRWYHWLPLGAAILVLVIAIPASYYLTFKLFLHSKTALHSIWPGMRRSVPIPTGGSFCSTSPTL